MSINTGGYQVQVMPTYSPVDPSRVAFNPMALSSGVLSGMDIINELAKQKAFAQAQAELSATREGRLGAMNAQNLATIQLAPQKNLADIALAQQQQALVPGQTEAGLAAQQQALALRPFLQNVERQKAETADALAVTKADQEIKQAKLDSEKQDREAEIAPLQGKFDLAKLTQEFNSLDSDKNMSDAQKLASIRNTLASAAKSEADARKDDRMTAKVSDPVKELDDIQMQIQRLKGEHVIDPNLDNQGKPVPYIQYQGATRDVLGNIKPVANPRELLSPSTWLGGTHTPILNPAAERVANQIKVLEDRRAALISSMQTPDSSSGAQVAAPSATVKSSSGAKAVTTQAEFNALPSGSPFIWNGRPGIKK